MNRTRPILIDGGLSQQLSLAGHELQHPLWTASLLKSNPKAILDAHVAFLEAGAELLISSSYQANPRAFIGTGCSPGEASELLRSTISLAREAIHEGRSQRSSHPHILVAASIGPYGAYLADGSEYHGQYQISRSELRDFHRARLEVLEPLDFDWYACETMPSLTEALVLADLLKSTDKKVWITFTCKEGNTIADGTPFSECIRVLASHAHIQGLGINCTSPRYITSLLMAGQPYWADKDIVLYPNSGEIFDAQTKTWSDPLGDECFHQDWREWLQFEIAFAGGCCRIGAQEIASMQRLFDQFQRA